MHLVASWISTTSEKLNDLDPDEFPRSSPLPVSHRGGVVEPLGGERRFSAGPFKLAVYPEIVIDTCIRYVLVTNIHTFNSGVRCWIDAAGGVCCSSLVSGSVTKGSVLFSSNSH